MMKNESIKQDIKKEKNFAKIESGITLIALVVTIIILLILAGVVINMAIRWEWLIWKSKNSKRKSWDSRRDRSNKASNELTKNRKDKRVSNV